jgi:two-component system, LytTR family, sensor kinase
MAFILVFCLGILISAFLRVPLAMFLNEFFFLKGRSQPSFIMVFTSSFLNICIWTILIVTGKLMIDRFTFQKYVDEVSKQKEQAELDFLNAQFNPHFLFNSINSIYGHIDKHNTDARHMLLTFSDMLRYQLYDCSSNSIHIEKEIQYIRNYIELQKARKEEGFSVELHVENNVKNISVAPLLFIAFIENCFKYVGINAKGENKISISFCYQNELLHFKCINSKGARVINHLEQKGIGISNAKRRLALIYPKKNELTISDSDSSYEVNLAIQTQ